MDDPSQRYGLVCPTAIDLFFQCSLLRDNFLDEKVVLRSRVAELEGVIREVHQHSLLRVWAVADDCAALTAEEQTSSSMGTKERTRLTAGLAT